MSRNPNWIPPDTVQRIKEIDLLTYLQRYEPHELVRVSAHEFTTRTHDSLKISNGIWRWYSRGISHKSALDYLVHVRGMGFQEAVRHLHSYLGSQTLPDAAPRDPPKRSAEPDRESFELPAATPNNERVISYLTGRGIDRAILADCIAAGLLYESEPYHNAVFVGKDAFGTARYAFQRGTWDGDKPFKRDAPGSDKRYAFALPASPSATLPAPSSTGDLYVAEGAIDALSIATLMKMRHHDWRAAHILSLGGVAESPGKLPSALAQYLADHPEIGRVTLCLDNDAAGLAAAQSIQELLPVHIVHTVCTPRDKDWNETLQRKCRSISRAAFVR